MNTEDQKQFDEADKKFDIIMNKNRENALKGKKEGYNRSQIRMRDKTFMKISDVDTEDAEWFKGFCDKHTDRKQFLGIKVIRTIMENLDPLVKNVLVQINSLTSRVDSLEAQLNEPIVEHSSQVLPQTQGGGKKK